VLEVDTRSLRIKVGQAQSNGSERVSEGQSFDRNNQKWSESVWTYQVLHFPFYRKPIFINMMTTTYYRQVVKNTVKQR